MFSQVKEFKQLSDQEVMIPVRYEDLTPEERRKALRFVVCIKEKRSGEVKGRASADGRPQRKFINKEEVAQILTNTSFSQSLIVKVFGSTKSNKAGRDAHRFGGKSPKVPNEKF